MHTGGKVFHSCYIWRFASWFIWDRVKKLVVYLDLLICMSLLCISKEETTKQIWFMKKKKLISYMQIFSLMCQNVNLVWNIVVSNVGFVFAYLCCGHKNNFPSWFCSLFKHEWWKFVIVFLNIFQDVKPLNNIFWNLN